MIHIYLKIGQNVAKINFTCFHCGSKLRMPAKYAGRKGRCPKCKAKNTIPSNDDTLEDTIIIMFNDIDDYEDEEDMTGPDPFALTQDGLDDMGNPLSEYEQQDDDDEYKDDDDGNLPNG